MRRSKGQAIIEFALCFLIFISLILATFNVCFWIFAKSATRRAVREGVRFAITGRTLNGPQGNPLGQDSVIKQVVVRNAWPFVQNPDDLDKIKIEYFQANGDPTPGGINLARSTIMVSVVDYQVSSVANSPLFPFPGIFSITARAVDKVEPFPGEPVLRVLPIP